MTGIGSWLTRAPVWRVLTPAVSLALLGSAAFAALPLSQHVDVALLNVVMLAALAFSFTHARARSRRESGRGRVGWSLVAAAFATVSVSVSLATVVVLVRRSTSPVPLLDALTGLGLLAFLAGLVALCGGTALTSRRLSLVDSVMVAAACLYVLQQTLLAGDDHRLSTGEQILYADLGAMSLILVLALLFATRWRGDARTLGFVCAGIGVEVATLVALAVAGAHGTVISKNDPRVGVVFPLGTALLGVAAAQRPQSPALSQSMRRQWNLVLGLPLVASLAVGVTAALQTVAGRPWDTPAKALATLVVAMLVVRQGLTLLENRRLTLDLEQRVTERTAELEQSRQYFRDVVQHSSDVIVVLGTDGRVSYCSPSVTPVLGYAVDDVLGRAARELVHPDDLLKVDDLVRDVSAEGSHVLVACRVRHADGSWPSIEASVARSSTTSDDQAVVVSLRDVTDRARLEERLRHQAFHDPLTGLANRTLIQERMQHALQRARRTGDPTALVFVDLDNFKRLNDTAGHSAGDQALVHVADVIRGCIRPEDTAARLGGDEFAVLLEQTDATHGQEVASRIVHALKQLHIPTQRTYLAGASVGVAVVEGGRGDGEALLRDADIAMYQAKSSGRGRAALFKPTMRDELVRELALETALTQALRDSQLHLVFQPIVDLRTGAVAALEALVRWTDERGHVVQPSAFIPLAERVGLIGALDRWVLRDACAYVARLGERCPELRDVALNVNVSARDLDDLGVVESWAVHALSESGLPPERLVLEITETAVLPDSDIATPLARLRDRGIRVSLDDFGTGYSSMTSLEQLPLDELKVDGSFVAGIQHSDTAARVVEGIVGMAHSLGLPVVAEAVETPEQADLLRRLSCEYGQGHLFAPPMPADELECWSRRVAGAA